MQVRYRLISLPIFSPFSIEGASRSSINVVFVKQSPPGQDAVTLCFNPMVIFCPSISINSHSFMCEEQKMGWSLIYRCFVPSPNPTRVCAEACEVIIHMSSTLKHRWPVCPSTSTYTNKHYTTEVIIPSRSCFDKLLINSTTRLAPAQAHPHLTSHISQQ